MALLDELFGGEGQGVDPARMQMLLQRLATLQGASQGPGDVVVSTPESAPQPNGVAEARALNEGVQARAAASRAQQPAPELETVTGRQRAVNFLRALGGEQTVDLDDQAKQRNMTAALLMRRDPSLSEQDALAIVRSPDFLKSMAGGMFGGGNHSLTPVYGTDEQGNLKIGQLNARGQLTETKLPTGFQPATKNLLKVDAGTHYEMVDPVTKQVIQRIQKDVAGAAEQKKVGEGLGTAKVDLPKAEHNATLLLKHIKDVEDDKGLDAVVGSVDSRTPTFFPSSVRAESRLDQIQGETFLQAFQSLKGAGQISNVEGEKATNALNRLSRRDMSEADYRQALKDFKTEVQALLELARKRAGQGGAGGVVDNAPPAAGNGSAGFKVLGVR
jgi:hypothetical protein